MQALVAPLLLTNVVQGYDWGSPDAIPRLLGREPDGTPCAELWLGAHPSAPSRAAVADGEVTLDVLVRNNPGVALGRRVSDTFGPRLPFLLKVLAAERALSLQVHPKPHAARAGFNRENRTGVPAGSPQRSFHDDQHKPEMVVALTQVEGLAGFRTPRNILSLLDGLEGRMVAGVRDQLVRDRTDASLRAAFSLLLDARADAHCAADIKLTVESVRSRLADGSPYGRADQTVVDLAEQHPGDPGAIASLMLNRFSLEPGESVYTPAGEVHAYLSGVGVEVMASSDNVLRAGLTTKHVDTAALVECASFTPNPPAKPSVEVAGGRGQLQTYRAPVPEFALTVADVDPSEPVPLPAEGPRIVLALDGAVALDGDHGGVTLAGGRSAFVPHAAGTVTVTGTGQVVCAWVP